MRFIWSTRGRDWGFRFLRDAGLLDPLQEYEDAFRDVRDDPEVCLTIEGRTALRFADPEGRTDRAGRVIPHEFVVFDGGLHPTATVAQAREVIWPRVSSTYATLWSSNPDSFSTDSTT